MIHDDTGGDPSRMSDDADDVMEQLRSADPAAVTTTDLTALRAKVDILVADDGGRVMPSAGGSTSASGHVVNLAGRRRRRPVWLGAAAVSVGALVLAGGGYTVGVASSGNSTTSATQADERIADSAAAPFIAPRTANSGRAARSGTAAGGPEIMADSAPGSGMAEGGASSMMESGMGAGYVNGSDPALAEAWNAGRFAFTGTGLSSVAGEAESWAIDAEGVVTRATLKRIAKALDIDGDVVDRWGTLAVGMDKDGMSANRYAEIYNDGSFSFNDSTLETPRGDAPSEKKARAMISDFLDAIGVDLGDARVEMQTSDDMGDGTEGIYAWVTYYPTLGGKSTGMSWSFTVTADGVQSAWGSLAPAASLGRYTIISPSAAFDRLSDTRFSSSIWTTQYPAFIEQGWETSGDMSMSLSQRTGSEPAVGTPAPAPGTKISWPTANVAITDARLGLSTYYQNDGAVLILPTYELRSADGGAWAVLALADEELNF